MIEAHTFDAWTRTADAIDRQPFRRRRLILGGFAAPLFLWLAGRRVVLSASTPLLAGRGSRAAAALAVFRRGVEIFILAFLFRLQAFIVSPGSSPVTLFRVDILNIMGPAIAAAGARVGACRASPGRARHALRRAGRGDRDGRRRSCGRRARRACCRSWVQWYFRPAGDYTTFTAFPWVGFVFAGGAVGALIAEVREPARRAAAEGLRSRSSARLLDRDRLLCGVSAVALPSVVVLDQLADLLHDSRRCHDARARGGVRVRLARRARGIGFAGSSALGRHSLFVYWIHVELVYGYASWLWRGRLPSVGDGDDLRGLLHRRCTGPSWCAMV